MADGFDNTPTVCVVMVPCNGGLLMIRRALPDGKGKLALPGGFQVRPDSVEVTGAREVFEETGVNVDPETLIHRYGPKTVPGGYVNLVFYESPPVEHTSDFVHDHEVEEVVVIHEPVETAFPLHTMMVKRFFESR